MALQLSGSINISGSITAETIVIASTASFSGTSSWSEYVVNGGGVGFPYAGNAIITGSLVLDVSSSFTQTIGQLLQNGDFTGNADGWVTGSYNEYWPGPPATVYYDNNLSCSYDGTGDPTVYTVFPAKADKYYKVAFTLSGVQNDTVYTYVDAGVDVGTGGLDEIGDGQWEYTFRSDYTGELKIWFDLWNYNVGGTFILDDVSVTEYSLPTFQINSGSDTILKIYDGGNSNIRIGRETNGSSRNTGIFIGDYAGYYLSQYYPYASPVVGMIGIGNAALQNSKFDGAVIAIGNGAAANVTSSFGGSVYLGNGVGNSAHESYFSTMVGYGAGLGAESSSYSTLLGYGAGQFSTNIRQSTFIGAYAGNFSGNIPNSVAVGYGAGTYTYYADKFLAIGYRSGLRCTWGTGSIYLGSYAGAWTTTLESNEESRQNSHTVMIGEGAGAFQTGSQYSVFIGYQSGYATGINGAYYTYKSRLGRNNIVIGTNITLEEGRKDSINIGGVIFGTGSYFNTSAYDPEGETNPYTGPMFSGSAGGKIGINQPLPQFTLDVNGSGQFLSDVRISGSLSLGDNTAAVSGIYAHAEGYFTIANGVSSHAEGSYTIANGDFAHSEGWNTTANGLYSHAEGENTETNGERSHAEGYFTRTLGAHSHAEGNRTQTSGAFSHAEGYQSKTGILADYSHAEGYLTNAAQLYSHAEGWASSAGAVASHAEGLNTQTFGQASHAEGDSTYAGNSYSHAEGRDTRTEADWSHVEGRLTRTGGDYSHAEGYQSQTTGGYAHAEGYQTQAVGGASHTEGRRTIALGAYSHTAGLLTTASVQALYSDVVGFGSVADGPYQTVVGQYNISSSVSASFIVGNGSGDATRSNLIYTTGSQLQITGSTFFTGSVTIDRILTLVSSHPLPGGGTPTGSLMSSGSNADNKPYYWNGAVWTALF